ncbi:hypothetical protein [Sphaerotilus sp.]|uniref:hypothetical protein n=1 Tax=Sphaerotilus sp. TaxID=2093942 RepID=UPI002ACDC0E3|nr:hypothetical protein [Sphaerotilus sp.]MDZ7855453.1 hypothetical protein [Sphaerotilus sp.]
MPRNRTASRERSLRLLNAGLWWLGWSTGAVAAIPCAGPPIVLQPVAPQVWMVPGADGDSTPDNRGAISNLLAVREGRRLWLIGSGPSATYARALNCHLQRLTGQRVTDVIAPWPRPELVLGQAGLAGARRWAHEDVAQAMQERCPRCVERLRQRLGPTAADLGAKPIALPVHRLHGDHGTLGPLRWWRLRRSAETSVTVWSVPRARLSTAHGLLWADGAPDLRDAESGHLDEAWQRLDALGDTAQWLPEQGPLLDSSAPRQHRAYLQALRTAVDRAQERGAPESDPAPVLDGVDARFGQGQRHALNWQHVWREAERRW